MAPDTGAEKGGIMHRLPEPVSRGKFTSKTSALWQILYVSTRLPLKTGEDPSRIDFSCSTAVSPAMFASNG
jgi:hypothetical protein